MPRKDDKTSRRTLLSWLGILSLFTVAGAAIVPWKSRKRKMVKMLTEDGKLVEVDAELLGTGGGKISNKELQSWVKK